MDSAMVGWRDYKVNQLVADQIAPMLLSVGVHELRVVDERVVDHPLTVELYNCSIGHLDQCRCHHSFSCAFFSGFFCL